MSKKLINGGLMIWEDYLKQFVLPARVDRRGGMGEWANEVVGCRSEKDMVPDPMLGALLEQERQNWSAGASMNAIVMGLPWAHRVVLFGELMGYSDETVAGALQTDVAGVRAVRKAAHAALLAAMKRHASVARTMAAVFGLRMKLTR